MNHSTNRVQRYTRNVTRAYYRLLDWMQRAWYRFRASEVGTACAWLLPRLVRWSWWLIKATVVIYGVLFLFMFGMLGVILAVFTGNTKEMIRSITKIAIVLIGLIAVKKAVSSDKGTAVIKAISKAS